MSYLKISITKINAMEIADGMRNQIRSSLGMTSDEEEKLFSDRASECNNCPNNDDGRCTRCGCILKLKTKSFDSDCPDGRWNDIKFNNKIFGYGE